MNELLVGGRPGKKRYYKEAPQVAQIGSSGAEYADSGMITGIMPIRLDLISDLLVHNKKKKLRKLKKSDHYIIKENKMEELFVVLEKAQVKGYHRVRRGKAEQVKTYVTQKQPRHFINRTTPHPMTHDSPAEWVRNLNPKVRESIREVTHHFSPSGELIETKVVYKTPWGDVPAEALKRKFQTAKEQVTKINKDTEKIKQATKDVKGLGDDISKLLTGEQDRMEAKHEAWKKEAIERPLLKPGDVKTEHDVNIYRYQKAYKLGAKSIDSFYNTLKELHGEKNADKAMRELEVKSWGKGLAKARIPGDVFHKKTYPGSEERAEQRKRRKSEEKAGWMSPHQERMKERAKRRRDEMKPPVV
jgi:hypothetical protein